ncbi:CCAAT/enhancer-binding protein zeta-like isoform X2 [Watersipora subatra]|uniref:CCAAT/enhancer-binding protein zeta-like isoform X2 n=1 Tax=Watersipora subatra TaxID=2589382 RepID=UPI00355B0A82
MISKGTLADRAAALTTLIQEDAVHNISSLEGMVKMVSKKDRRESMAAIGSLKDIFIDLLPNKRRLRSFQQMPLESLQKMAGGNKETQDRLLALWYFESRLKKVYETFISAVLSATFDTVIAHKLSSLKVALDLLTHKPEQEQKLLAGLINKLGDPERKVAANTAHLLGLLVRKHPNMKLVVATEVENLLYRSNIAPKAQYYAVCFLNQMLLSETDKDLSVKLITIYFSFFKASIKTNEVDSKMMSALLVGVVRAFPFAKGSEKLDIEGQMGAIYKLVHTVHKLHVSLQALALLFQVCTASDSMTDRYYTSLYAKLLDSELKNSSKQSMFLNLVYKSMKSDPSDRRCKAFVKRLLQICAYQSPTFICAALITISELVKIRPGVLARKTTHLEEDDSEEEHFVDADSDDEGEKVIPRVKSQGWTHKSTLKSDVYDGLARNPLSSCADKAIETELVLLSRHYHPSVVVFAKQLLSSEAIVYGGDPMTDFSLQKFLDRFVFRNPKKINKQGKAEHLLSAHKKTGKKKGVGVDSLAVNTEDFYKLDTEKVPADQMFFHSYFHKLTENSQHKLGSSLGKAVTEESDDSDVDDDAFDTYLAKYEKSLYKDLSEDAFGEDFASDFKKSSKSKGKKSKEEEESDSDSGLSDDDLEYTDAGLDLKLEDFGLNEDDIGVAGLSSKAMSSRANQESDDDIGSDISEDLPLSLDGSDDGDIDGLFAPADDFDEEGVAFSDDEFSSLDFSSQSKGKRNTKKSKTVKRSSKTSTDSSQSLFAAADELADLLDEESADKRDTITSHAVVNRGKTDTKQLAWEDKQERWLSGRNRKRSHKPSGKKTTQRGGKPKRKK